MASTSTPTQSPQVDRLIAQQDLVYQQMKLMVDTAAREDRGFTDEEDKRYKALSEQHASFEKRIGQAAGDQELLEKRRAMLNGGAETRPHQQTGNGGGSWGQQFIAATSDFFRQGGHRASGTWRSPHVDIPLVATTLTEDPSSGGALIAPDVQPGPIPLPTRPLRIADLFGRGMTGANTIRFMVESVFSNAAAPVGEGQPKPESALVFTQQDEPVRKIAHFLPVSDEMLEDAATIRSYIDARLRLGVLLAEEDQLLNGDGTAPNLLGLLNRPGLTPTITQTTEAIADLIAQQLAACATASNLQPDAVILSPNTWLSLLTTKTTTGAYLAEGAPFVSLNPPMIWGVRAIVTVAVPSTTIVVGSFALGGVVFRHTSGLRVESTNAHQDWFQKNLTAIRAEERIALAIVRASAFGKVVLAP